MPDGQTLQNRYLLKFCSPSTYALANLGERVLYCQHFAGFNDPFEFWTKVVSGIPDRDRDPERFSTAIRAWGFESVDEFDPDMIDANEYFDSISGMEPPFESMLDHMRVACFGSERDNLLMWSHYADGLRGFCIVFDERSIVEGDPEGYIMDVAYLDAPPIVDSFVYAVASDQQDYHLMAIEETRTQIKYAGKSDEAGWISDYQQAADDALESMKSIWQQVFGSKPMEWKYEKERRLLVQVETDDRKPVLRPYPKEAVKEIIVGERMPAEYLVNLKQVVSERVGAVPIRMARRARDGYSLVIE